MKKLHTIVIALFLSVTILAQTPEKISYQAILRDADNALLINTTVGMQMSILQGSDTGTPVYIETQMPVTNDNGLVTIEIGTGTSNDNFADIEWGTSTYFLKTEIDIDGGTNYTITGVSELLSVPYSLYSKSADTITGDITETDPIFDTSVAGGITSTDTTYWNNKKVPIYTTTEILNLTPENGDALYNSTDNLYQIYFNNNWVSFPATCWPQPTTSNAGPNQTFTDPILTTTLAANTPVADYGTGAWSIISGTGGSFTDTTSPTTTFTGTNCTDYTLRWTITTACNNSTDDVAISFNQTSTIATAGPDQSITDATLTTTLAANTPDTDHGTGAWSIISGTDGSFADATSPTTTFTGTNCTDYTLRWTITTACDNSIDDVAISFNQTATIADAGPNQSFIDTTLTVTLAANTPDTGHGTGAWSIISGTDGSFTDDTSPTTTFTGILHESYVLRWTISTICNNSYDEVIIDIPSYDVTNPTTGQTWMDRNLGATQVATSSTDAASYGDLYQWGRGHDGHQIRTSATTTTLSSTDVPGHGNFILVSSYPYDWRSPQNNNLWLGISGTNNHCPTGYRIPTDNELSAELASWTSNNPAGAFASPLKLPVAGYRYYSDGSLIQVGSFGIYWSSTVNGGYSRYLYFGSGNAFMGDMEHANGFSVRCIKESATASVPGAPTIGTATGGDTQATVTFTAPTFYGGSPITSYTATSSPGNITGTLTQTGSGTITITGLTNGTAYTFTVTATNAIGTGPASTASNSVTPTVPVPNVTNPTTGEIWMDRNLGATQVATSSTDTASYGDLYQWGRGTDGHQIRTSATTSTLSSTDVSGHGNFIVVSSYPWDWRSPKNDNLWQGVGGTNNPCPTGYRIPTETELNEERASWGSNNSAGAFTSPLKLPVAGRRHLVNASLGNVGSTGIYWSSTIDGLNSHDLFFIIGYAGMDSGQRAYGFSVRCIKD